MMSRTIQYPFACDEQGALVSVHDIQREHRYEHMYTCPECGKTLRPRLGEKNAKHFYHSDGQACGIESYLHRIAKLIFAARINSTNTPFKVSFQRRVICEDHKICPAYKQHLCSYIEPCAIDLAAEYDLPAEIEPKIEGLEDIYRPDVCIKSSNPEFKDIFLEVWYKHKSSEKKIHSGHRIIEFHIKSEDQLLDLLFRNEFKESADIIFYNFERTVTCEYLKEEGWHQNPRCPGSSLTSHLLQDTVEAIPSLPRLCCNCVNHRCWYDGAEWCSLDLDISSRKGTYDESKAEWCERFRFDNHSKE